MQYLSFLLLILLIEPLILDPSLANLLIISEINLLILISFIFRLISLYFLEQKLL